MGLPVAFRRPMENPTEQFLENLNVVIEPLPTDKSSISLEDYNVAGVEQLKKMFPGITVASKEESTLAGNPAIKSVYSYVTAAHGAPLHLKLEQVVTMKDSKIYILTYTATEENYDKYLPLVQEMVNSFGVESPTPAPASQ